MPVARESGWVDGPACLELPADVYKALAPSDPLTSHLGNR